MLLRKMTASVKTVRMGGSPFEELSPVGNLCCLVSALSREFRIDPQVWALPGEKTLWVLFQGSCCDCDSLLEEYGALLAASGNTVLCGTQDGFEEGELAARLGKNGLILEKCNATGRDYSVLSNVCLRAILGSELELDFSREMIGAMNYRNFAAAADPKWVQFPFTNGLFDKDASTYYRFMLLEHTEDWNAACLSSLTIPQIKTLWIRYLDGGVPSIEFELLYDHIASGDLFALFPWELALRLALSELSIVPELTEDGFVLRGGNGGRIRLGPDASGAERLFLKILFPVVSGA